MNTVGLGITVGERSVFIIFIGTFLIFAIVGLVYMFPFGCFFFGILGFIVAVIVTKLYVMIIGPSGDGDGR